MKAVLCCVFAAGALFCGAGDVLAQGAKGLDSSRGLRSSEGGSVNGTGKQAAHAAVLQVLKEGLLMRGSMPWLLVGHPEFKTAHDGMEVNCYVRKLKRTHKYTDTMGAERTVPVYEWISKRSGK